MTDPLAQNRLADPWWRLNNLYFIKDKAGEKIRFRLNWAQRELYNRMWFLNDILKARQLGMTTFIQIFMLDRCLFNDNVNAGIVAHNKEDAEAFFSDKIKFAYDNLPQDLKLFRKATSDTTRSLKFSNGSHIRVGTSMRSGTYQYIHISEFGKMCAKYPDKAREVITGTLNTVAPGQMVFVESTAEGPHGEFYEMCQRAKDLTIKVEQGETEFTQMDYKFFFFPWWKHPDYVLREKVEIPDKLLVYFHELHEKHGIELTGEQKAWYVKKSVEQGSLMKQEYPSTPEEAFEQSDELVIYGEQLRDAREQRRIGNFPFVRGVPVNTFWDIGRNDVNAIWLHQHIEGRHRFPYYFEDSHRDLTYYVDQLLELKRELKLIYGTHYLPHDVKVTDVTQQRNLSREEVLREAGLSPIVVVPRIPRLNDGIELMRRKFPECCFDEEGCATGLRALRDYKWSYDEYHGVTRDIPARTWGRNAADALRQFAQGYRGGQSTWKEQLTQVLNTDSGKVAGLHPRRYARSRSRKNPLTNPDTTHLV